MDCFNRSTRYSKLDQMRNTIVRQEKNVENSLINWVRYRQLQQNVMVIYSEFRRQGYIHFGNTMYINYIGEKTIVKFGI